MSKIHKLLQFIFIALFMNACSSTNTHYTHLYHYSPANDAKNFTTILDLVESFTMRYGNNTFTTTVNIKGGKYIAQVMTDEGIFYQSDSGNIVHLDMAKGLTMYDTGGFFVPFDKREPIRLWHDASKRELRDNKGSKIMPIHLMNTSAINMRQGSFFGVGHSGILLSPPISSINDHEIKLLKKNRN